jgi:transcriptional regulator with XRE-family HTH domain
MRGMHATSVTVRDTGGMPRQTPRMPGPDEWAARRIRRLRESNGWSAAELARLVTEAGCPIRQQSIWDIENRQPPRRITLGEAAALASVFGIALEDLAANPAGEAEDQLRAWWTTLRENIHMLEDNRDRLRSMPEEFQADAGLIGKITAAVDDGISALERASGEIENHLGAPLGIPSPHPPGGD